ncbi:Tellurite resistance protein TerB [Pseudovibrio sp. Ad13]|uniref:tellurite resistance TerB family protein n=1 Tax=unclassified Pseudovibrio TaxID=2627060 RepID=UPI0007AE912F|nr:MULTISPECIES: TerB family tellurite resistance protein [unclassified Pseudovibrio]KZK76142.1 Tellurite resistance protein TerB [Pseudovibrio sp. Ad46]KZK79958.1 Tellurite resistance protein TerB [Pseudovibrio sp. Ad13]KZK93011.1 Tellurite resistance protein TerB [Pseudovibrio sp. W74]KZK98072.1 Tellurite resistance protein TerB [Pseudovibrio sp. Ad5]KZL04415.1 Tellurite resistance protein TerB [Pseudovibrio sp. Ad14]
MLDALKKFFKDLSNEQEEAGRFSEDDERLAVAALMFHIIAVDGEIEQQELDQLKRVLQQQYELNEEDTKELMDLAKVRDEDAVDLYGFTSVLKRKLEPEQRLTVIEALWEMVYADGSVHEFEDNTIWRVAELLGVSSRDRMKLKQKVAKRQSGNSPSST